MKIFVIAFGGALGALARYWITNATTNWLGTHFPYGTLLVNCVGSLLIGFSSIIFIEYFGMSPNWRAFVIIGLLGSFTTFSTFSLDTVSLLQQTAYIQALLNVLVNILSCLIAVSIGIVFAKIITA